MNLFAKKNPIKAQRTQEIKARISELLKLDEDTTVIVTELNCQDEDCPEVETVIALFRPGLQESKSTLHSAIEEITDDEIVRFCQNVQRNPRVEIASTAAEEIDLPL